MVRWRVGTLSMGLALIALGIILLVGLVGGFEVIDQVFKWWPILLIIIGGEILIYIFRAQEEQVKVKYDVFSIFMIMVIFFASSIFYGISTTGLAEQVTANINSRDYSVMIPQKEVEIGADIKKIVINIPSRFTLSVNKTEGKEIIYKGDGEVFTTSIEAANEVVNGKQIYVSEVEDTLYLQFPTLERRQELRTGVIHLNYEIFIPQGLDVELKGSNHYYTKVVINGDAVDGNWNVSGSNSVIVNGNSGSDFILEAMTENRYELRGNVEWQIDEKENRYSVGKVKFGEGSHQLTILKAQVEAIKIP